MKKMKAEKCDTSCSSSSCCKYFSVLVLVVGLLYLLQDYGMSFSWWQVSPWTALFVLVGFKMVNKSMCK